MVKLTKKEIERIQYFRHMFPREIEVDIRRSMDGGFVAEVLSFPGCITEANTLSGLVEMVNDAIRTMLEVPKKYVPFVPEYLMPMKTAQRFNIFPIEDIKGKLTFLIHEQSVR